MNEQASTSGEGSPAVENAERQIFGSENYQKVEVVHRFADAHPWFLPLVATGIVASIIFAVLLLGKYFKKRT